MMGMIGPEKNIIKNLSPDSRGHHLILLENHKKLAGLVNGIDVAKYPVR